jgi:hypothetical protein
MPWRRRIVGSIATGLFASAAIGGVSGAFFETLDNLFAQLIAVGEWFRLPSSVPICY